MNKWIKYIIGGVLIGFANIVPGVSGGTVAVTLNIYRDIIDSLSVRKLVSSFRTVAPLFLTLGGGAIIGILILARIMSAVLQQFPLFGTGFFIGLIVGGVPAIFRDYRAYPRKPSDLFIMLFGCALVVLPKVLGAEVGIVDTVIRDTPLFVLLLSGFCAAIAMTLPGLSGSLVLLLFGSYSYVLAAVNNFDIPILLLFSLSVIAGIFCCAKLMRVVFRRFPRQTWALILGLVLGSVVLLWPPLPRNATYLLVTLLLFLVACVLSYALSKSAATE